METTLLNSIAQFIIILSGIWLIVVSGIMFIRPQVALNMLRKAASTNFINYMELSIRGIWGLALLLSAPDSRFSQFFYIIAAIVCISTVILLLIPRKWHAYYAIWWADKLTLTHIRFCAPFSLAFGLFLIYAFI